MSESYDRCAAILAGAVADAWFKIWRDLADAAQRGEAKAGTLDFRSNSDLQGFFEAVGSGELEIRLRPEQPGQITEGVRVRSLDVGAKSIALIVRTSH